MTAFRSEPRPDDAIAALVVHAKRACVAAVVAVARFRGGDDGAATGERNDETAESQMHERRHAAVVMCRQFWLRSATDMTMRKRGERTEPTERRWQRLCWKTCKANEQEKTRTAT